MNAPPAAAAVRTARRSTTLALGVLLAGGLWACAASPRAEAPPPPPDPGYDNAVWIAAARPHFATIQRDTHYAVVADPNRDLLIIEDDVPGGRLTWLVTVPAAPDAGVEYEVGSPIDAVMGEPVSNAWLYETPFGAPGHLSPARGFVRIESVEPGEVMVAAFDLETTVAPPSPGRRAPVVVGFQRTAPLVSFTPEPAEYQEMQWRGGMDPAIETEEQPPIWSSLLPDPPEPKRRNRFGQ